MTEIPGGWTAKCDNCQFSYLHVFSVPIRKIGLFGRRTDGGHDAAQLYCRRFPNWRNTNPDWWCGEYTVYRTEQLP